MKLTIYMLTLSVFVLVLVIVLNSGNESYINDNKDVVVTITHLQIIKVN